jgi:hypothetical protein
VNDDTPRIGIPYYQGSPMRCTYITDDTRRYDVQICGARVAWAGCSWCEQHLRVVSPRAFARLQACQPTPRAA